MRLALLCLFALVLLGCRPNAPTVRVEPQSTPTLALIVPTPPPTISPLATPRPRPFAMLLASDRGGMGELYMRSDLDEIKLTLPDEVESAWQPAMNPISGLIGFTGRRGGQSDIALTSWRGDELQWLTAHPADDHSPAWSWDGQRIAWVSERGGRGQVWWMDVATGEAQATPLPGPFGDLPTRHPAWAPDGTLLFAAVDPNGIEEIFRHDPQRGTTTPLTAFPLKATMPAVNGVGEIVFVGWEEEPFTRGLYCLAPDGQPELLWQTTDWIGDPVWSADDQALLFTRWSADGGGHDLWALSEPGGGPQRLTSEPAWETDAVAISGLAFGVCSSGMDGPTPTPHPTASVPRSTPHVPRVPSRLRLGFNIANLDNAYLSRDLGFAWGKGFAFWERIEAAQGQYDWRDVDNTVNSLEQAGLQVFLRVDRTPTWARPPDTPGSHPPTDLEAFGRFWEALATRYRGRVAAYELWNEPNLSFEWGNQPPDPARYVEMLRVARAALRRADPDAPLIVGALAVTETGDGSMNEMEWMDGFYAALQSSPPGEPLYEGFSTHPYGFGQPPDTLPETALGLRRLEQQRATMERWGDFSPMWLTELGYIRHTPGWTMGNNRYVAVSDETQGRYLVETIDWLEQQYSFVEAAFFFNLDFGTVDWYVASEEMRAFAILDSTRRPLPAFSALRERWRAR